MKSAAKVGIRPPAAAVRRAMTKDVDFLVCLGEVEAAMGRLREAGETPLPAYRALRWFCRAVRAAKLQLKSVLRYYGTAYGADQLQRMASEAVTLLPSAPGDKATAYVCASIRRHDKEIEAALEKPAWAVPKG